MDLALKRFLLVAIALLFATSATSVGAPFGRAQERHVALEVTSFECPYPEGVCLAYDGMVPGPVIDINLGDTLVLTLFNNVTHFDAAVSVHAHGMSQPASMDGVHAFPGTGLVDSFARPGESFTYRYRAAWPGTWHYHDHVMGLDGAEGAERGLYGTIIVRSGAEPRADHVLDLHMLDRGPNGGRGLDAAVPAGDSFEIPLVCLGDRVWDVTLTAPDGARTTLTTAPGLSDRFRVDEAMPGVYRWVAVWADVPVVKHQGSVVVS